MNKVCQRQALNLVAELVGVRTGTRRGGPRPEGGRRFGRGRPGSSLPRPKGVQVDFTSAFILAPGDVSLLFCA